jgi:hypothetical protein
MSQEVRSNRSGLLILALYVGVPGLLLIGLVVFLFTGGSKTAVGPQNGPRQHEENHLAAARSMLANAKQADLGTCKAAVAELNAHLQKAKEHAPAPLDTSAKAALAKQWRLSADELEEVASPNFTALDAHHLETCFLLRDAARWLELARPGGRGSTVKQSPLEQAELAFDWVMRQVRLPPPASPGAAEPPLLPLAFTLRRGWGTAQQRALVFLALIEQLGIEHDSSSWLHGALLFCPDDKGHRRLWACGVAIGDTPDAFYLFDPRLGLPIPGPDGKGIATLEQARNDPKVLGQLDSGKLHYDVTFRQARDTDVCLSCALTSLAPRMVLLQDRLLRDRTWNDQLLPNPVRVHLATDVTGTLDILRAAVKKSGGNPTQVREWPDSAGVSRRFLSKEEGGSNAEQRLRQKAEDDVVPWQDFKKLYESSPRFLQPDEATSLGLGANFRSFFVRWFRDPESPRELILRGRYPQAARALRTEQDHWRQMRNRWLDTTDLVPGVRKWVDLATTLYADSLRARGTPEEATANARVAEHWKYLGMPEAPIAIVLHGAAAEGRGAEVTYQLGLCMHEQAARQQALKELAARGKVEKPEDGRKLAVKAKDAEVYWKEYVENYADRPGASAVALRRSETQVMRSEFHEAIRTLETAPDGVSDLEKLARAWLIGRLRTQAPQK